MGWKKHHFIIVTHYNLKEISEVHSKAIELFNLDEFPLKTNLVSDILPSIAHSQFSFFVNCDGTKEGQDTSDLYDRIRAEFTRYLTEKYIHFVEIGMHSDNEITKIENASNESLIKIKPYYEHEDF
ncbi:hypothetical protein [Paenibacillus chitinolyticus]|uniref:hypothetical protein n=1 Tax=Paenibacillus chitinolyticus TaxID=79263 RepID=UPI001C4765F8|nr:hypothetical protein [Paenibacillus chitinolyticus]